MHPNPEEDINQPDIDELVARMDVLLLEYEHLGAHRVSGAILSRVILMLTLEPEVGKGLMKWCWERFDEIEEGDPGSWL